MIRSPDSSDVRAAKLRAEIAQWDAELVIRQWYAATVRESLTTAEQRIKEAIERRELAKHKLDRLLGKISPGG